MRLAAVLAAALLLSSCTWVRHEIEPAPAPPTVRPEAKPAARPHVEHAPPAPVAAQPAAATPPAPPPVDYSARCRAMADNRADDAKGLGAPAADQAKIENDTYRDCMAQSVK